MKKITAAGPFGGKNIQMLGADGKQLTQMEALREKNRLDGTEGMNVIYEEEANQMPQTDDYMEKVKRNLKKNLE